MNRSIYRYWGSRTKKQQQWMRVIAIMVGAMTLIQCVYPSDRALPLARLNDESVGFKTHSDIHKKLLVDYGGVKITTRVNNVTSRVALEQTGLVFDGDAITSGLSDYPWYLRVLPLSLFIRGALTDQPVRLMTDASRFSLYATERAQECAIAPKNAGVMVSDGEVVLDPSRDGAACSLASLKQQLTASPLEKSGMSVAIKTTPVAPKRSNADVSGLLRQAQTVAARSVAITVAGKQYPIDKPTLASWLAFPEDATTKQPTVGVDDAKVRATLETIQKDIYIEPGTTVVTTRDGIETGRATGRSGQGIDMAPTIDAIRQQVTTGDGVVAATVAVLPPKLAYNRSYSKTPEGLQALVNDLAKDKGDVAVSVRKLGDSGVHANGDRQYETASTYKLFVAYSVLKRIDGGQMNWNQPTSGGQTTSQCFDAMIIQSDNACAEWFGKAIGWTTIQNEVRSHGLAQTKLGTTFVSTTNDLALFLQKLESNQLGISEPSRARLLDAMKRQVFRRGIPAGVGAVVANKVGFLDGYLHDAALVYAPSGVYVMTMMSKGSSWAAIADAARQIYTQLQ